jgi:alpha-D-ribose 1-methylphosphonate 5-triphosphate synthase subunit PhnL
VWVCLVALWCLYYSTEVAANICPNSCSGHGNCNVLWLEGKCVCYTQWSGAPDCSLSKSRYMYYAVEMGAYKRMTTSTQEYVLLANHGPTKHKIQIQRTRRWSVLIMACVIGIR